MGLIVFLCVMFCTRETVVQIDDLHWRHTVVLEELRENTVCGNEVEIGFDGNTRNVFRCRTRSEWETISERTHQGDDPQKTTWPPDPVTGHRQRVVHEAEYVVLVHNDEGNWKHTTSNLPWAQRFRRGELWFARVNRAGMAWPERPAGAEE